MAQAQQSKKNADENGFLAALSYISFLFIIPLFLKRNNKFVQSHAKQGLVLFIAEIGMNHNGNFDLAYELIKQAKYADADIAKFQLGWRDEKGEINCIDADILQKLNRWCEYFQIEFMVSIFTKHAFELAKTIDFKRYKIASRTVKHDLNLVKKIISQDKETIISLSLVEHQNRVYCSSPELHPWNR